MEPTLRLNKLEGDAAFFFSSNKIGSTLGDDIVEVMARANAAFDTRLATKSTTNLAEISEQYGKDVDIVKLDIEGRWYEMLTEMINIGISPKIILCECEMDLGDVDTNFSKLDHIVQKYQQLNYKVWTNRINTKNNIELIFQKI